MVRHLKIFEVEKDSPCIFVTPVGQGASFRYADLQMEANTVRTLVSAPEFTTLIIDLGRLDYFGSEFIGALIIIGREKKNRGGKVALCNANDNMYEVLKNMAIFKLWPYYEDRAAAVEALKE